MLSVRSRGAGDIEDPLTLHHPPYLCTMRRRHARWHPCSHTDKEAMMQTPVIFRNILAYLCRVASRCQHLLPGFMPRVRPPTHPEQVPPPQAHENVMLVESDVKKGVRGILP